MKFFTLSQLFLRISTPQSSTEPEKAGILNATQNTLLIKKNSSIGYSSASLVAYTFHFFLDNKKHMLFLTKTNTYTQKKKKKLLASDMVKRNGISLYSRECYCVLIIMLVVGNQISKTSLKVQLAQRQEIKVSEKIKQSTITPHSLIFYYECIRHAVT